MHGASTSTRSNAALRQVRVAPTVRPSVADHRRPAARGPPARPAGPGARRTSTAVSRGAAAGGERAEQRRPCRPGPAHRSSQRSSGPVDRRRRPARRRPAGSPRPARGPGRRAIAARSPGAPAGQVDRVRRERARRARRPRRPARPRRSGPAGRTGAPAAGSLSAASSRVGLGQVAAERVGERPHDPLRMGVRHREVPDRVVARRPARPAPARRRGRVSAIWRSTALAKPAAPGATDAHQVDRRSTPRRAPAPGCAAAGRRPSRSASRAGGSMRSTSRSAAAAMIASSVPARAQRAVGQLGGERRVPAVQPGRRAAAAAAPGWRTRRRGAPRRAPRTRPAGPGRRRADRPAGRARPVVARPAPGRPARRRPSPSRSPGRSSADVTRAAPRRRRRTPRAQSAAGIGFLPAARTSPSATGVGGGADQHPALLDQQLARARARAASADRPRPGRA